MNMITDDVNETPRRHIISCRISEKEFESLTRLLKVRNTTVSQLLRDALGLPALLCGGQDIEEGWPEAGS